MYIFIESKTNEIPTQSFYFFERSLGKWKAMLKQSTEWIVMGREKNIVYEFCETGE